MGSPPGNAFKLTVSPTTAATLNSTAIGVLGFRPRSSLLTYDLEIPAARATAA